MTEHRDHVDRIHATPSTPLPKDTIRTHGPIKVMLGAAPDRTISVGLLIEAEPPIGPIEVYLTGDQITELHHQLDELVRLDHRETTALISRLHDGGTNVTHG